MKKVSAVRLVYKRPMKRLVFLTLLVIVISYFIGNNKDFLFTLLIKPIHLTGGNEGSAFLNSNHLVIGELEALPVYYTGYDVVVEYSKDERHEQVKANTMYYTWIGEKIVLCQYTDSAETPSSQLVGKQYKCYCVKKQNDELMNGIKESIVHDTKGTKMAISESDFSPDLLRIFTPEQFKLKKIMVSILLVIAALIILRWLWFCKKVCCLKSYSGIKSAIKKYGAIKPLLMKIDQGTFIFATKELILTEDWLVHGKSKEIIACDDIVWLYHKQCEFPFLEHTKTYIYTRDYKKHCVVSKGTKGILQIYDRLIAERPEIILGYSDTLMNEWKQDPKHFIASNI